MISLRQRIRKDKIRCLPWKLYKYNIRRMPISAQTLFAKDGIPIDIFERELKDEGWLFQDENLWDVLTIISNLKRAHLSEIKIEEEEPFDENWTEDDYINYYEEINKNKYF